jgi:peptidoglycan/LPS O-acetylase OafA/YrhL
MTNAQNSAPIHSAQELQFFQHIPALDGLRGIAILLVLIHNAGHFGAHPSGPFWVAALIGAIGWVGVQLFFVLSGFLITTKLLATQGAPNYFSVFFGRRVLRIFPLYYAALIVGLLVVPAITQQPPGGETPASHQIWLWTFLLNWSHPLGLPAYGFPHFWSLAVEEQFYLLWPFVVYRATHSTLARVCYALIVAALVIRTALALNGASEDMIYEFTVCRMDALAMGALLAVWLQSPDRLRWLQEKAAAQLIPAAFAIWLLGAVCSRVYTRSLLFTETVGYTLLGIFFALILLACLLGTNKLNRVCRRFLSTDVLRSIGKYSFAMYVFHYPIQLSLERFLPRFEQHFGVWSGIVFLLIVSLASYVAAFFSYHLFEKHFLRLKSAFTPRARLEPAPAELPRHA